MSVWHRFPRLLTLATTRVQDDANAAARSRVETPLHAAVDRPKSQALTSLERDARYYADVGNAHMAAVCRQRIVELRKAAARR